MNRNIAGRLLAAAALAAIVTVAALYRDRLDAAALEDWVRSLGVAGPMVFIGIYALGTVAFLPGSVLTLAGGALFGPVWGTVYNLTGATMGAVLAFLVARFVARAWVTRKAGGRLKQLLDGVESEGWRFVAVARLVPLFPFNLLNYAFGLTGVRLAPYAIASFIFMLPGAVAYTYLGYAGREAAAGAEGTIQKGLLALALLAVMAFLPRLVQRWRKTPEGASSSLTAAELKARLATGENIPVLDVRAVKDYAGPLGHVPGSVNIPVDELSRRLGEVGAFRRQPLAVICRTNWMSKQAVKLLRAEGFEQVLLVADGMVGWCVASAVASNAGQCADVPLPEPLKPASGTPKRVTIVVQNAPYRPDNKAWHALRFAGAALAEDMTVRVHLLDEGVGLARRGQDVPPGAANLEQLLVELVDYGLEVRACTMALGDCQFDENAMLAGVEKGSMKSLAAWIKESDVVMTF